MIRIATKLDISRIEELLNQVHEVHVSIRPDLFKKGKRKYYKDDLEKLLLDQNCIIFVYEEDNNILGYSISLIKDNSKKDSLMPNKTLFIDDLCVDKDARNKGIGHKLYDYNLEYAKHNGFYNLTLNVWEGNEQAIKFYKSLGMHVQEFTMETLINEKHSCKDKN